MQVKSSIYLFSGIWQDIYGTIFRVPLIGNIETSFVINIVVNGETRVRNSLPTEGGVAPFFKIVIRGCKHEPMKSMNLFS